MEQLLYSNIYRIFSGLNILYYIDIFIIKYKSKICITCKVQYIMSYSNDITRITSLL